MLASFPGLDGTVRSASTSRPPDGARLQCEFEVQRRSLSEREVKLIISVVRLLVLC